MNSDRIDRRHTTATRFVYVQTLLSDLSRLELSRVTRKLLDWQQRILSVLSRTACRALCFATMFRNTKRLNALALRKADGVVDEGTTPWYLQKHDRSAGEHQLVGNARGIWTSLREILPLTFCGAVCRGELVQTNRPTRTKNSPTEGGTAGSQSLLNLHLLHVSRQLKQNKPKRVSSSSHHPPASSIDRRPHHTIFLDKS